VEPVAADMGPQSRGHAPTHHSVTVMHSRPLPRAARVASAR
jgi:hypothetical protein